MNALKAVAERQKRRRLWPILFICGYGILQLVLPLRHLIYKRDLQWTHEGIDFSWHMMGDHHETRGEITVEDPQTGNVYLHAPQTILKKKQLVMVNNPYTLLQYVHFLKGYLRQHSGLTNPIIKADIQVSVNGKLFQNMYDPSCNLSEASYSPFEEVKWIIPLQKSKQRE
jgi:hypothetical protein